MGGAKQPASGLGSRNARWAIRVGGTVGYGVPGVSGIPKLESIAKPGPVFQGMLFEIKNLQTGESAMFTYSGLGIGAGIGRAQANLGGWTEFETESSITLRDFVGTGRTFNASVGLGLGAGMGGIVFHGISMDYGSFWEILWHGDSVPISGINAGTSLDISETVGAIVLVGYRPDPESDAFAVDEQGDPVAEPVDSFDMMQDAGVEGPQAPESDEPDGSFDMEADAAQAAEQDSFDMRSSEEEGTSVPSDEPGADEPGADEPDADEPDAPTGGAAPYDSSGDGWADTSELTDDPVTEISADEPGAGAYDSSGDGWADTSAQTVDEPGADEPGADEPDGPGDEGPDDDELEPPGEGGTDGDDAEPDDDGDASYAASAASE